MRNIAVLMIIFMFSFAGCTTRLVDFTMISSKNIDLSKAATFKRAKSRAEGEDMVHWIIFVPVGTPSAKEALDRAIESVPGAVALVDGVITGHFWWIPYIYGQQKYVVEGTPLIDPSLASVWTQGKYLVTHLNSNGMVEETKSVSKSEYNSLKSRLIPVSDD